MIQNIFSTRHTVSAYNIRHLCGYCDGTRLCAWVSNCSPLNSVRGEAPVYSLSENADVCCLCVADGGALQRVVSAATSLLASFSHVIRH